MQLRHTLFTLLFALCCADVVLGRHALQIRQDTATPASTGSSIASTGSSPSTTHTSSATTAPAKTESPGSSPTTSSLQSHGSTTTRPINPANTGNATESAKKEEQEEKLPIQPSITPAVGIAGVLLLLTGTAYTIIGIKHQWLLVFLSSAYLASLSVTVLVIYVMHPPVSHAIQGAYMVAALMTGLIFGVLALIFKEVTGGFGCLVGGFCLSMWFLCLKPGGLLTTTTGKAVMIGVFSAVGWSLAFSQYTRTYGLIFCTAFAGATVTVLGIDCFSRAGLKEFWIYIWNLNSDEFPLHTTTYPITRGIRAEIAAIIILCILGIISQIKVWKIVKERKAKKEEERMEGEAHRDQRDSRIGRAIEVRNSRSLAQWEAIYGEQDTRPLHPDSGVGTSVENYKRSASVTERELDSIELEDIGITARQTNKQPNLSITHRVASEDVVPQVAPELRLDLDSNNGEYSWWADFKSSRTVPSQSNKDSIDVPSPNEKRGGPSVPPLPLPQSAIQNDETALNRASAKSPDGRPVNERRGVPLEKLGLETTEEDEEDDIARIEDDRASSIAATADEDPDFDALSKRASMAASMFPPEDLKSFPDELKPKSAPQPPGELPVDENDDEALVQPPASSDPDSEATKDKAASKQAEVAELRNGNLSRVDSISKVAMAYRTNEWAKHIAEADQPDAIEEELNPDEPGVQVDVGRPKEDPRPVDATALAPEQTRLKSPKPVSNPYHQKSDEHRLRTTGGTPVYAFQRPSSSTSLNQPRREARSAAVPLSQQPIIESPVDANFAVTNNLMDERNDRVESRPVTANFNGLARPSNINLPSPSETPSTETQENEPISELNITLAQRKSLMQQAQQPTDQRQQRNTSVKRPSTSRMHSTSSQNLIYDSHQPRRASSVNPIKQNAMLTQWRQSLQQESYAQPVKAAEQHARQSMIDELRYRDHQDYKQEAARKKRESKREVAMRTGQLTTKHKDAMRKMQAQVNENAR